MRVTQIWWFGRGHETESDPHDIWEFWGATWPKMFRRWFRLRQEREPDLRYAIKYFEHQEALGGEPK
jgi:hypothetical protein